MGFADGAQARLRLLIAMLLRFTLEVNCFVRSCVLQLLLSLGLLLAGPLFGWGGNAQAGYLARFIIVEPGAWDFGDDAFPSSSCVTEADAVVLSGPDADPAPRRAEQNVPSSLSGTLLPVRSGGCPFTTGTGGHPVSSDTNPYFGPAACPQLVAADPIGFLFLQDGTLRPPPLPSRLFRPPRCTDV